MRTVTRWRLYTEDTRHTLEASNDLDKWIAIAFPAGATIFNAEGVWHGGNEMSICIEVLDMDGILDEHEMTLKARSLRDFNKQEAVMLTCDTVTASLI